MKSSASKFPLVILVNINYSPCKVLISVTVPPKLANATRGPDSLCCVVYLQKFIQFVSLI